MTLPNDDQLQEQSVVERPEAPRFCPCRLCTLHSDRFLDFLILFGIFTLLDIEITISTISRFERFCLCRDSRLCITESVKLSCVDIYILPFSSLFVYVFILAGLLGCKLIWPKHQVCIKCACDRPECAKWDSWSILVKTKLRIPRVSHFQFLVAYIL